MVYLDSSALLKLLSQEEDSDALDLWLSARGDVPKVSSELAKVEVTRGCRRLDDRNFPAAQLLLSQLDLIPLAGVVIEQACDIGGETPRSLDALHLASALTIGTDLAAFVAYDHRLTAYAAGVGLPTIRPGS